MPDFAELSIEVEASAQKAMPAMNSLIQKLENLNDALSKINVRTFTSQLQELSGIDLSNLNKTINLDLKLDGKSVHMTEEAARVSADKIRNYLGKAADDMIKAYHITNKSVQKEVREMFDSFATGGGKDASFNSDFLNNVAISKAQYQEMKGNADVLQKEWADFLSYFESHKIKYMQDVKEMASYQEYTGKNGSLTHFFSGTGTIDLENGMEHLSNIFPSIVNDSRMLDSEATKIGERVQYIVDLLEQAKQMTSLVNVADLGPKSQGTFFEDYNARMTSAIQGMNQIIEEAKLNLSRDKIYIDVDVNEERIVSQIEGAINRAATRGYTPINVKLNADTQSIRKQIEDQFASIDFSGLDNVTSALDRFNNVATKVRLVQSADFNALIQALRRLANVDGSKLTANAAAIKDLFTGLNEATTAAEKVPALNELVKGIVQFGYKRVEVAIEKAPQVGEAINQMLTSIANAPAISPDTISAINAVANFNPKGVSSGSSGGGRSGGSGFSRSSAINLSGAVRTLGRSFNSMKSGAAKAASSMANFAKSSLNTRISIRSLASSLMHLYFRLFMIRRLLSGFKTAITKSMDMIETYHYFDVAMGKVGNEARDDFAKYGYDSAEAYAKSFRDRSLELTERMSGYTFDENGNYRSNGMKNLGLDADTVMQYQAQYGQMANSIGMSGEAALATSKALTMLATDWSSLRNIDFDTAFQKMASGLAGQSRAVRALGIDITQASLQQTAYNLGITTSISKMDQAAKAELRMITILDQSRVAWGDLAETLNTPANQFRMLQQNAVSLARALGNIFMPIVQKVLPYINALVIALRWLFEQIAGLLGIQTSGASGGIGGLSEEFADLGEDASDSLGGIADGANGANSSMEKLKRTVLSFDELNILNDPNSGSSNSGSGSGGTTGLSPAEMGALDSSLIGLLDEYQRVWDEAFGKMGNKAQELANKITGVFKTIWDYIKQRDWKSLGTYIASGINIGLNALYDTIQNLTPKLTEIVGAVAQVFNGMVDYVNWARIGQIVGEGLNLITSVVNRWYSTFSAYGLGARIATAFNSLQTTVNWEQLGEALGRKIQWVIDLALGFVNNVKWSSLGTNIATSLNSIMGTLKLSHAAEVFTDAFMGIFKALDNFNQTFDWKTLKFQIQSFISVAIHNLDLSYAAQVLNDTFTNVLDVLSYVVDNNDWVALGRKVGNAIRDIEWGKHFRTAINKITTVLGDLLKGVCEGIFGEFGGDFATGFVEGIKSIIDLGAAAIWLVAKALEKLFEVLDMISPSLVKDLGGALGAFFAIRIAVGFADNLLSIVKRLAGFKTVVGTGELATNTGVFATKIGELVSHASGLLQFAGTIGIVTAATGLFIDGITRVGEAIDRLLGGNGQLSEGGGAGHDLTSWLQSTNDLLPEQAAELYDLIEQWESAGYTNQQMADAIIGKLREFGVSEEDVTRILEGTEWQLSKTKGMTEELARASKELGEGINQSIGGLNFSNVDAGAKSWDKMRDAVYNAREANLEYDDVWQEMLRIIDQEQGSPVPNAQHAFEDMATAIKNMYGEDSAPLRVLLKYFRDEFPEATQFSVLASTGYLGEMKTYTDTLAAQMPDSFQGTVAGIASKFLGTGQAIYDSMNSGQGLFGVGRSLSEQINNGIKSKPLVMPKVSGWQRVDYGPPDRRAWFDLPTLAYATEYARGGSPNAGELFWMNENNNPELMYKKGGRTHIDSNTEIVNSLKEAVIDGMMEVAMATSGQQNNNSGNTTFEVVLQCDSETLFRTVQKGRQKLINRGFRVESAY